MNKHCPLSIVTLSAARGPKLFEPANCSAILELWLLRFAQDDNPIGDD